MNSLLHGLRAGVFCLLQLLFSPITLLALCAYAVRLSRLARRTGVSATSFEPLLLRALLHRRGVREDAMAWAMLRGGPMGGWALHGLLGPTLWASRLSGFRGSVFRYPPTLPSSLRSLVHHRTVFFDDVAQRAGREGSQLVLLGAGWDSRAYAPWRPAGVRVFEVDLPRMQEQKRVTLAALGTPHESVRFVPVDLASTSFVDAAVRQGLDPRRKTVVIWEGVTYYLERSAVTQVFAEIGAKLPCGVLAVDFPSQALVDARPPFRLVGAGIRAVLRWFREPWRCGFEMAPSADADVAQALEAAGLRIRRFERFGGAASLGGILEAEVAPEPEELEND